MDWSATAVTTKSNNDDFNAENAKQSKVMEKVFGYLSDADLMRNRLVCQKWRTVANFCLSLENESKSKFLPITRRIEILDKIFSFLNKKEDRGNCRLVCFGFNVVARFRITFTPILTDITRHGILRMNTEMNIRELRTEDLYSPLPVTIDGKLDCDFNVNTVKVLSFYEGTSTYNKHVLLVSFPFLEELKYFWTSTYTFPQSATFDYLTVLHIRGISHKENGNLQKFFSRAKFRNLKEIHIELHFRRDLMLYMELHRFIANHNETLKTLQLEFKCYFFSDHVRENAGNMLILLNNDLIMQYNQIVEQLKLTDLETLVITFLDCEGTGMFHLSFTLLLAQTKLKTLSIVKEYTRTRREFLPLYNTIKKNENTIQELCIPHPYNFNCSSIQSCHNLQSITVGHIYEPHFVEAEVQSIELMPKPLKRFRMSIRLKMVQIEWIIKHLDLTEFSFRGYQGQLCTLNKIQWVLRRQPSLTRLEFECEMTAQEFKIMKIYFSWTTGIRMDWSNYDTCEDQQPITEGQRHRAEFHISIDRATLDMKMSNKSEHSEKIESYDQDENNSSNHY